MSLKVGDMVKHCDADREGSIPAYRALRGRVVSVSADGLHVRVHWTCDQTPDFGYRKTEYLTKVEES